MKKIKSKHHYLLQRKKEKWSTNWFKSKIFCSQKNDPTTRFGITQMTNSSIIPNTTIHC
jgi:hypothetical protein